MNKARKTITEAEALLITIKFYKDLQKENEELTAQIGLLTRCTGGVHYACGAMNEEGNLQYCKGCKNRALLGKDKV